jgi:hypothetical protein
MSPEWTAVAITAAIQLIGVGAVLQKVRDHERRISKVEAKIDKWQEEGIGVKLAKAHNAHGGV